MVEITKRLLRPADGFCHFEILSTLFAHTIGTDGIRGLWDNSELSEPSVLPPREEMRSLLNDFFRYVNTIMPLYHEPTFLCLVERLYLRTAYPSPGLLACINVAIALSYAYRICATPTPDLEDRKSWDFFRRAARFIPQLMLGNPELLSIQALVGMVCLRRPTCSETLSS